MKKVIMMPILVVLNFMWLCSTAQSAWHLDTNHSQLSFSIAMLNISDIEGTFKIREAVITASKDDFSEATLVMEADTKSVNTGIAARDAHLRTPDFFDAGKYPSIIFKSNTFKKTAGDRYQVTGDLSMHGITKTVTLDATAKTVVHPITKKTVTGFRVTGSIKRTDFGISPSTPPDMLSDEVMIRANVQFEKK